jgi:hypothetical protein
MNGIVDFEQDDLFPTLGKILCPLQNCNESCSSYKVCIAPYEQKKIKETK